MRLIQATCYTTAKQFYFLVNSSCWNWNQSDASIRWIHTNIYRLSHMKLKIGLKNFKGVFVRVWFIIATGDRLTFDLFDIDKNKIIRWLYPGGTRDSRGEGRIPSWYHLYSRAEPKCMVINPCCSGIGYAYVHFGRQLAIILKQCILAGLLYKFMTTGI